MDIVAYFEAEGSCLSNISGLEMELDMSSHVAAIGATRDGADHDDDDRSVSSQLLDTSEEDEFVNGLTTSQAWNLYTSHFLSTWNVRTYEFAAVSPRLFPNYTAS